MVLAASSPESHRQSDRRRPRVARERAAYAARSAPSRSVRALRAAQPGALRAGGARGRVPQPSQSVPGGGAKAPARPHSRLTAHRSPCRPAVIASKSCATAPAPPRTSTSTATLSTTAIPAPSTAARPGYPRMSRKRAKPAGRTANATRPASAWAALCLAIAPARTTSAAPAPARSAFAASPIPRTAPIYPPRTRAAATA